MNEIATARLCLLKPASKSEYDAKLRKQLAVNEDSKADDSLFANDDEMAELTKAPKLVQKAKRKKSKPSPSKGVLIAGGIGVIVVVV